MKQLILGYLENNTYLISGGKNDEILYIIDPAADPLKIIECATHNFKFEKVKVLLTHAHADHIGALKEVCQEFKIDEVYMNEKDLFIYNSSENAIPPWLPSQSNLPKIVNVKSNEDFEVISTPGHTPGGVCFYFRKENILFSGDTLFYRSIGRSDLPGGNERTLNNSIREKLFTLDEKLMVYPGHGNATTIGDEKKLNPYV